MQCNEFESRMNVLLDLRQTPETDRLLLDHAQNCPPCRDLLDVQEELFTALELCETPSLPGDFARNIVNQVRPRASRSRHLTTVQYGLAIAAMLLIAIVPAVWLSRLIQTDRPQLSSRPSDGSRVAVTIPADSRSNTIPAKSDWWVTHTQSILELYPERARRRHREQVDRIADEFRPVATSFAAAMTALRRTLPIRRDQDQDSQPPRSATTSSGWSTDFS